MNKMAILTTSFNHIDNVYFKDNWNKFSSLIKESNTVKDTYICEVLPTNSNAISTLEDSNHYTVYNNSELWHKECGINYLLKKIPDKYEYVFILDNDIFFDTNDWYPKVLDALQSNVMIQPFDELVYLEKNSIDIEKIDRSMVAYANKMSFINGGNPGIAVAYHRDYLDQMNGLFDECIVGGGDLLNIIPFFYHTHAISPKIFDMLCQDSISSYFKYLLKAKNFLKKKKMGISFIANLKISHLFHGYLKDRQYYNRYNIINQYNLYEIVKKTDSGFYELENQDVSKMLETFFNRRQSIKYLNKPTIMIDSVYGADSDDVLWLAPCDRIRCRNIDKISINIENKHQQLKNICIVVNGEKINIEPLLNNGFITIDIDNPDTIMLFSTNPPKLPNDVRELGLLITSIKILNKDTDSMMKYHLSDVL